MSEVAFERVKLARDSKRPTGLDYIKNIFIGFTEFHGDRRYADDPAIVGGIAKLNDTSVTVIAIEKGHTAKERTYRNFGMPQPEGYRKALRLMKQAEKFGRPVICFVDTSGAYCGIGAEERGQGQAIAENLLEMSTLCVPIMDAAKRRVFRYFTGGLCEHPLEGCGQGRSRGGKPEINRRGRQKPWRDRTDPLRK